MSNKSMYTTGLFQLLFATWHADLGQQLSQNTSQLMKNMCWGHSLHEKFHIHMLGTIDFPMKCHNIHVLNWFNCRIPGNLDTSIYFLAVTQMWLGRLPRATRKPAKKSSVFSSANYGRNPRISGTKNCQNVNVELAIKIYVQCKKKRNSPCSLFTLQFTRLDSVSTLH